MAFFLAKARAGVHRYAAITEFLAGRLAATCGRDLTVGDVWKWARFAYDHVRENSLDNTPKSATIEVERMPQWPNKNSM